MQFFLMFFQLAPSVISLVKQIEDLVPGQGKGKEKLDLVLNTVNTAVAATPVIASTIEGHDLNGAVTSLVAATVATANATGAFKK